MDINKKINNDLLTVTLIGRLDTNTAPMLQEEMKEEISTHKNILLDFSEVDYISSAGLRTLLFLHKNIQESGGAFSLSNCNEIVLDVFKMTGFDTMLNIK